MKIRLVGAQLFNAGRWTDGHDEADFTNAPKTAIQNASSLKPIY